MTAISKQAISSRESSFEFLRLLAQYMIVLYHILMMIVYPVVNEPFYRAIWLPLHIGVPLFVFISGYFGIHASPKVFFKLLAMVFVLQVPASIVNYCVNGGSYKELAEIVFFVSHTPNWFIRTYLFLYIFSPVINLYIEKISFLKRILLLSGLFFMSHYVGTLKGDPSLIDGKNLITFIFFYVIGNTLRQYQNIWRKISKNVILFIFLCLNIFLISFFSTHYFTPLYNAIYYRICFHYCSPLLLLNAILFFIYIGQMRFHSNTINYLAKSSLSIYLLQGIPLVIFAEYTKEVVLNTLDITGTGMLFFFFLMILAALITITCILIDNLLNPAWFLIAHLGTILQTKYETVCVSVNKFAKKI